ncbi:hypothetical protein [Sphingobium sp. WCS2017Hpa-17]|uniref:hypothetical protein n=1 Tax=Sphingobium sp. WCS2017Hpa-17 TaxID=3073638 RepID=UPI00288BA0FF|nr:hypothetical protein [Sphingobium sp. WCS2017Hpa-17]
MTPTNDNHRTKCGYCEDIVTGPCAHPRCPVKESFNMDRFAYFERAVRRLNPLPAQRREWAEQDAILHQRLAAMAECDANAAWIISAAEAGRADPDPFFSKGQNHD